MRILIIGAGGHAQVVADCLLRMAEAGTACRPIGFVDDNRALHGKCFLELPVLGALGALDTLAPDALLIGIGNNHTRQRLYTQLQRQGYRFATAIHPRAIVAPDVQIGSGSMLCAGAIVNTGSTIGANVILNTGCTVDHHNIIGDHAHVAPGAHLGGDVSIGEGTLIGIGATVMPQRNVGKWSVVGAAALVHNSVCDEVTVVGVPAKEMPAKEMPPKEIPPKEMPAQEVIDGPWHSDPTPNAIKLEGFSYVSGRYLEKELVDELA